MIDYFTIADKMSPARKAAEDKRITDSAIYNCRRRRKSLFEKGILEVRRVNRYTFELYCRNHWIYSWSIYEDKYNVHIYIDIACHVAEAFV